MSDRNASLLSNIKALTVIQFFVMIAPFLVFPYLIRALGVEYFGLLSFALAISVILQMFFDFGTGLYGTRAIATVTSTKQRSDIVSAVLAVRIVLACLVFVIYFPILLLFDKFKSHLELFFLAYLLAFINALSLDWYFNGTGSNRILRNVTILSKVLYTALILVLIEGPEQISSVLLISISCSCLQVVITLIWVLLNDAVKLRWIAFRKVIRLCRESYHLFLSKLFVESYRSGGAIILGFFSSNEAVSYYSIAEKIVSIIQTLQFPVGKALMPYSTKRIADSGLRSHNRHIKKLAPWVLSLYLIVVCLVVFLAKEIVVLVTGKAVPEIIYALTIISPVILFGGLNYLMLCVYILPARRDIFFRKSISLVCFISLALALALVEKLQHLSVIYSLLVAEVVLACFIVRDFLHSDKC